MGVLRTYHGSFDSLKFGKRGKEIIAKGEILCVRLKRKIAERTERIDRDRKEMGLESAMDVLDNIESLNENFSGPKTLTAGLSAKLKEEIQRRNAERRSLEKQKMICRNLDPETMFFLTFDELNFFEF